MGREHSCRGKRFRLQKKGETGVTQFGTDWAPQKREGIRKQEGK